jgi:hypothetical protein
MQTLSYFNLLSITANSAVDTAHICYRKGRRDVHRIQALLTHPTTVKAAKMTIWCLYIGAVLAFALGQTARILIQSWVEAEVACALVPLQLESQVEPKPDPELQSDPELAQSDPELKPELESAQSEPQVEPKPDPDPQAEPHLEPIPALAQAMATPVPVVKVPVAPTPSVASLRKRCSAAGIRWRNGQGQGQPMSKSQMLAALQAVT